MADLKDKRFSVAIGLSVFSAEVYPMYAGPHYYGKLKYEDLVKVQGIVAKYSDALNAAMKPMVEELVSLGFEQAAAVEAARSQVSGIIR